ncbi:MAG: hypothetical protein ACSLE1_08460 [Sphingobium sp.]
MSRQRRGDVAFLFLGEMLLVPHLWPIVDALARAQPDLVIDIWVSTSAHEELLSGWLEPQAHTNIRLRHAPGYLPQPAGGKGENPVLPAKLPMLLRLARHLWNVPVVVCAEQTSLWLPRLLPIRSRFIFTVHGAGPLNYNKDGRLRSARRLLVPSHHLTEDHVAHGIVRASIRATGYVKSAFRPSVTAADIFSKARPVLLYAPHWQRYRSSWWDWGRQIVQMLAAQDHFNVILAPHQRLFESDPDARGFLERFAALPHVHVDSGSFAMVDGSYTKMADLYLGDSSSQIIEYLANPKPCVILDSPTMAWEPEEYRRCGTVVRAFDDLWPALIAAAQDHAGYRDYQQAFAREALGDAGEDAPMRAAQAIVELLP